MSYSRAIDTESENGEKEYKLTPLEVGNVYTREDGFINVTNLCKA